MTTSCILVGLCFEEHDLEVVHPEYAGYKRNTLAFVPRMTNPTRQQMTGAGES